MKYINKLIKNYNKMVNDEQIDDYRNKKIFKTVDENLEYTKKMLGNSFDLITTTFNLDNEHHRIKLGCMYMHSLCDQTYINEIIIKSIKYNFYHLSDDIKYTKEIYNNFRNYVITSTDVNEIYELGQLFNSILGGDTAIFVEQLDCVFIFDSRKYKERSINEPTTDISVKGPKDCFTENISTNISLIRKRIKIPDLWIKKHVIGKKSNTDIAVAYIKGIADEKLLTEVEQRIRNIESENILDSSYIRYHLREKQISIFPLMYESERPDVICSSLFEGKVVIIVDGSPFVLVAPMIFVQLLHTSDDYYQNSFIASTFRLFRFSAFHIALLLPAIYISIVRFHQDILPVKMVMHIVSQRVGLPFPSFFELIIMAFAFDLLREAGIRMPNTLGSAISIVGALIIGTAAVEAGLVSAMMVIIVALTAVCTLLIPSYNLSLTVSVLRYIFILIAIGFGFYGITIGISILYIHLTSLRSFGTSYMTPFIPFNLTGQKDALFRFPYRSIFKRKKNFNKKYPY